MKILKITIAVVLCLALSLSLSANIITESEFYYAENDVTVSFDSDSSFSEEQKQLIADILISGNNISNNAISTYSWCWLTGHDIISETVSVTEHKISDTDPRCRRSNYLVESCSKCDYMEYELISSPMILCCPEE